MSASDPTASAAEPARHPDSAATAIWRLGRAIGAPSLRVYREALETAMVLDEGQAALDRIESVRGSGSDSLAAALGALRDARTVQQTVVTADRRLRRMRQRARLDLSTVTPRAASAPTRRRIARLAATTGAFDVQLNPLVGDLAGTPEAARRALVDREPLFSDGTISSAYASLALDEVAEVLDELRGCLVEGFTTMTSGTPVAQRIVRRLRRLRRLAPIR